MVREAGERSKRHLNGWIASGYGVLDAKVQDEVSIADSQGKVGTLQIVLCRGLSAISCPAHIFHDDRHRGICQVAATNRENAAEIVGGAGLEIESQRCGISIRIGPTAIPTCRDLDRVECRTLQQASCPHPILEPALASFSPAIGNGATEFR